MIANVNALIDAIKKETDESVDPLPMISDRLRVWTAIEKYAAHKRELCELEIEEKSERVR